MSRLEFDDFLFVFGLFFLAGGELLGCFWEIAGVEHAPNAKGDFVGGGGTAQHAGDSVVVFQTDGVEFVVVATNATQRHAHEDHPDFADLGINMVGLHTGFVRVDDFDITHDEKAGGGDCFGAFFWRRGGD